MIGVAEAVIWKIFGVNLQQTCAWKGCSIKQTLTSPLERPTMGALMA